MFNKKNNILKGISLIFSLWLIFMLVIRVNGKENDIAIPCISEKNLIIENPKIRFDFEGEEINVDNDREITSGKIIYNKVPLMYQTEYPWVTYAGGTVASEGCGITSAAMIISYLTDNRFTPEDAANQFNEAAETNMERMEKALDYFDIKYEKTYHYPEMKEKLDKGYIAIVLFGETSDFTNRGHFVVVTGLNENGKIMVNDPNWYNYRQELLENGFANGFEEYQIIRGFSGAWIIEPKEMYISRHG